MAVQQWIFFFLWLNMIYQYGIWLTCSPLWAYATVYLSIHQLMDNIWMVYSLWLLWVMLLWNLFLHGVNIFSFYGYIQKSEISGSYGYSIFNFWGTDKLLFQSGCTILQQYIFNNIFQQCIFNNIWRFVFSTSSGALVIFPVFDYSQANGCEVVSHWNWFIFC